MRSSAISLRRDTWRIRQRRSEAPTPDLRTTPEVLIFEKKRKGFKMNFRNMDGSDGRPMGNLARQTSIYSLTFDEFQNTIGGSGKDFGSMNMDEFLKNIWTAEEMQAMASTIGTAEPGSTSGTLQRQGSLTLPRTLSQKTVDEVWRDLFKESGGKEGSSTAAPNLQQRQQTLGEMTLEEFLVRAGVVREDAQLDARLNNNSGFYTDLSRANNNNASISLGYQQPTRTNGLAGVRGMENNTTISNINQIPNQSPKLSMNMNGVGSQQQLFSNAPSVSYGSSIHGVEPGNPSMRVTLADSMINNGFGQGVAGGGAINGGAGISVGVFGAGAIAVATGSPANQLSSDGVGKRDGDISSLSPVPYNFNGGLRGRKGGGAVEKVVERRQRRMIKNRESAARSRARKQAYTMELEAEVAKLKEENQALQKKQADFVEMQKNQLLEILNQQHVSKKRCLRRTQTGPW